MQTEAFWAQATVDVRGRSVGNPARLSKKRRSGRVLLRAGEQVAERGVAASPLRAAPVPPATSSSSRRAFRGGTGRSGRHARPPAAPTAVPSLRLESAPRAVGEFAEPALTAPGRVAGLRGRRNISSVKLPPHLALDDSDVTDGAEKRPMTAHEDALDFLRRDVGLGAQKVGSGAKHRDRIAAGYASDVTSELSDTDLSAFSDDTRPDEDGGDGATGVGDSLRPRAQSVDREGFSVVTDSEHDRAEYFRAFRVMEDRGLKKNPRDVHLRVSSDVGVPSGAQRTRDTFLAACHERGLVPEPLGLVPSPGRRRPGLAGGLAASSSKCDLHSYAIGDDRACALAERIAAEGSVRFGDPARITELSLADNRLTRIGAVAVCDALVLNPAITHLDLSRNKVGLEGIHALCDLLRMSTCRVEALAVSDVHVADRALAALFEALAENKSVTDLDASHNPCDARAAVACETMITTTRFLRKVNLSWCNIRGGAAVMVGNALRLNDTIEDINLSFNSFGSSKGDYACQVLGETLAANFKLLHLQMSHNGIQDAAAAFLRKGLATNKSLMSLHFTGNPTTVPVVDLPEPTRKDAVGSGIFTRYLCYPMVDGFDVWQERHECWICGSWDLFNFVYRAPDDGPSPVSAAEVALSFNDWQSTPMNITAAGQSRVAKLCLMVPPGRFQFTYRIDGVDLCARGAAVEATQRSADDKLTGELRRAFHLSRADAKLLMRQLTVQGFVITRAGHRASVARIGASAEARSGAESKAAAILGTPDRARGDTVNAAESTELVDKTGHPLRSLGRINQRPHTHIVEDAMVEEWARNLDAHDVASILATLRGCEDANVLPVAHFARVEPRRSLRAPRVDTKALLRGRIPKLQAWSAATSLFTNFPQDTRALLRSAFESDWGYVKLPRSISAAEKRSLRNIAYRVFPQLKQIFKYYCSSGTSSDPFSLGLNAFAEMMQHCRVVDDINCRMSDIDTIFVATNYDPHKLKRNPDRSLARHNMLEAIIRVAIQRYFRNGQSASPSDALQQLLSHNILPHAQKVKGDSFRKTRLYSQKVEGIFMEQSERLEALFEAYSGTRMVPGDDRFMDLDEWTGLCTETRIISSDGFTSRDTNLIFVASIQTQANEMESDKSRRMHLYEFMEALARVADSLPNLTTLGAEPSPAQRGATRENMVTTSTAEHAPHGPAEDDRPPSNKSRAEREGSPGSASTPRQGTGRQKWSRLRQIGVSRITGMARAQSLLRKSTLVGKGGVPLHVRLPILLEHLINFIPVQRSPKRVSPLQSMRQRSLREKKKSMRVQAITTRPPPAQ